MATFDDLLAPVTASALWTTLAAASGAATLPAVGSATGTREGARACWGFIVEGLAREFGPTYPGTRGYVIVETYRRELEAMR